MFSQGETVLRRVIYAVMMREVRTRFGRNRLGYLWALAEPVFFVIILAALRYFMGMQPPAGMDLFAFFATGVINYILFRTTVTHAMSAINANRALLFYPVVRPLDIAIGRVLLEGATLVVVFAVLMSANAIYLGGLRVDNLMEVIAGFAMTWLLGLGLGLFSMGLTPYTATIERLVPLMLRPMLFISGVFYTAEELPAEIREILLYNPVLHTAELIRKGWFPEFHSEYVDVGYVIAWILPSVYFGLLFERFARRRMELT